MKAAPPLTPGAGTRRITVAGGASGSGRGGVQIVAGPGGGGVMVGDTAGAAALVPDGGTGGSRGAAAPSHGRQQGEDDEESSTRSVHAVTVSTRPARSLTPPDYSTFTPPGVRPVVGLLHQAGSVGGDHGRTLSPRREPARSHRRPPRRRRHRSVVERRRLTTRSPTGRWWPRRQRARAPSPKPGAPGDPPVSRPRDPRSAGRSRPGGGRRGRRRPGAPAASTCRPGR